MIKGVKNVKGNSERVELLLRIVVVIVTGIILSVWKTLIWILAVAHWFIVLFTGKRNQGLAEFSEYWNSEVYRYIQYLTFMTNERPFPFTPLMRFGKYVK